MYIYHIYREDSGRKVSIEYVAGDGSETLKELEEIANFRLTQVRGESTTPENIFMSRSLVPGI